MPFCQLARRSRGCLGEHNKEGGGAGLASPVLRESCSTSFPSLTLLCYKAQRQGLGRSAGAARAVEGRTPTRGFANAPTGGGTSPKIGVMPNYGYEFRSDRDNCLNKLKSWRN
jgi:hypothetical protein